MTLTGLTTSVAPASLRDLVWIYKNEPWENAAVRAQASASWGVFVQRKRCPLTGGHRARLAHSLEGWAWTRRQFPVPDLQCTNWTLNDVGLRGSPSSFKTDWDDKHYWGSTLCIKQARVSICGLIALIRHKSKLGDEGWICLFFFWSLWTWIIRMKPDLHVLVRLINGMFKIVAKKRDLMKVWKISQWESSESDVKRKTRKPHVLCVLKRGVRVKQGWVLGRTIF